MNLFNKFIVATLPMVPRQIVRYFAGRYIAGEELADAINVVKNLNRNGIMATTDVLGESVTQRREAESATEEAIEALKAITKEGLNSNVSIKLTQLGLELEKEFCIENVRKIVKTAKELNNFIRIDMEDSSCTDATIDVYTGLRKEYENLGIVLQAYLFRTEDDASNLIEKGFKNFRLCKGIYIEPDSIAFKNHDEINSNFTKVLELMLKKKAYVGIATHDDELIQNAYKLIKDLNLKRDEYEFQMLLGVKPELGTKIIKDGHRLRIYVPFGHHWYKYSIRRFKENPQIAGYVFKSLFTRNNNN